MTARWTACAGFKPPIENMSSSERGPETRNSAEGAIVDPTDPLLYDCDQS